MAKAIRIHAPGGADVFSWDEMEMPVPGKGEILLRQMAIGVNYVDVYYRMGLYAVPHYPITLGLEGCGIVEALGEGVTELKPGDRVAYAGRAPNLADMNKTPTPDFDEYFYARKEGGYAYYDRAQEVLLPIETARGCWWGVKNHCTFCGLNRAGMEFRSKRVDNVIEQLDELSRRYGILHFNAIDNIIEPEYIDKLFTQLSDANTDIRIHYEVRPSLSRLQLKQMRKGGLFSIQPGVESFSTHILKLMRKHTTGVRNLELIKWSTYYG